jgi:quaternary ammonium compound-resistance protein SugE
MAWAILFLAGLFEIGWAVGLKYTMGFTRVGPSVATLIAMVASLALLSIAVRTLPIGTAYAMWTGIGTVGAAILGIALFRAPAPPHGVVCILLIVVGLVGLTFGGAPPRVGSPNATGPR